jgi:hypothetical protein
MSGGLQAYAALMRSLPCRPRFHIWLGRYWGHESSHVPTSEPSEHSHTKTIQRRKVPLREHALLGIRRNNNVKLVEPPSCSSASTIVFIGKDSRGRWVAQEQNGLYGGLFINRAQAFKYALFENGHHPEMIVELSRGIELDMGGKLRFPDQAPAGRPRAA